jgi:hypothetical protein
VSDQQIDHQNDQQNTADTNATAISPPGIAETTSEEEEKYDNNQDKVHPFLRFEFLVELVDGLIAKPNY